MRFAKVLAPFPRFTAALLERAATLLDGGDGACEPTAANDGYSPGEREATVGVRNDARLSSGGDGACEPTARATVSFP